MIHRRLPIIKYSNIGEEGMSATSRATLLVAFQFLPRDPSSLSEKSSLAIMLRGTIWSTQRAKELPYWMSLMIGRWSSLKERNWNNSSKTSSELPLPRSKLSISMIRGEGSLTSTNSTWSTRGLSRAQSREVLAQTWRGRSTWSGRTIIGSTCLAKTRSPRDVTSHSIEESVSRLAPTLCRLLLKSGNHQVLRET